MTIHRVGADLCLVTGTRAAAGGGVPGVAVYRCGSRLFVLDQAGQQDLRSEITTALELLGTPGAAVDPICLDRLGHPARSGSPDPTCGAAADGEGRGRRGSPSTHRIDIGRTQWLGHTFPGADGGSGVQVLLAGRGAGRPAVFHLPRIRTMLLGELAGPAGCAGRPAGAGSVIRRTLVMLDSGDVDRVCGEAPGLDHGLCGDEARAVLLTILPRTERPTRNPPSRRADCTSSDASHEPSEPVRVLPTN